MLHDNADNDDSDSHSDDSDDIQEIMAKGVGFWLVVMIILTSVLTREHFLGEHSHSRQMI